MLSRRHIRIKVLQALYGYYTDGNGDAKVAIRNLQRSLDRIYELYLYDLSTLREILHAAQERIEIAKNKLRPTQHDLDPNLAFVNNRVLKLIDDNLNLFRACDDYHVGWSEYREQFKKIVIKLREDDEFLRYMHQPTHNFKDDKQIVKYIYATYICENDFLNQFYEDTFIHWADDLDAAQMMTTKTIKTFDENSTEGHKLVKLYKDKDDQVFGELLFRKVIANTNRYDKLIADKTKNWETDRIAMVDFILMKMALAEFTEFEEIPIKVSLNEYIELSKEYSTPKSGHFINGVLDKLVDDLKESKHIVKVGRGLL